MHFLPDSLDTTLYWIGWIVAVLGGALVVGNVLRGLLS